MNPLVYSGIKRKARSLPDEVELEAMPNRAVMAPEKNEFTMCNVSMINSSMCNDQFFNS